MTMTGGYEDKDGNKYIPDQDGDGKVEKVTDEDGDQDPNRLWGDVDGNGKIQTNDAKLILQYCAEMIGKEALDLTVSDVDGNGKIQTNDAKLILQYCAEMIENSL